MPKVCCATEGRQNTGVQEVPKVCCATEGRQNTGVQEVPKVCCAMEGRQNTGVQEVPKVCCATEGRQQTGDYWYLDTDFSWLYSFISVQSRVSVAVPTAKTAELNSKTSLTENETTNIKKKPSENNSSIHPTDAEKSDIAETSKEVCSINSCNEFKEQTKEVCSINSCNEFKEQTSLDKQFALVYYSLTFLYGLYAYEAVDDSRHFRALPLAWVTWNKNNSDSIYLTPFYFSYQKDDTGYFALLPLPLYAWQKKGKSYLTAYGIFLWWDEYKHKEQLKETSILWPLINWYRSPNKSGFRFIPVYYGLSKFDENKTEFLSLSPLHFYYDDKVFSTVNHPKTSEKSLLKLTDPQENKDSVKKINSGSSMTGLPLLPLIYLNVSDNSEGYKRTGGYSSTTYFPLLLSMYNCDENHYNKTSYTSYFLLTPLYLNSKTVNNTQDQPLSEYDWTLLPLPGFYVSHNEFSDYYNWLIISAYTNYKDPDRSQYMLLPLFYHNKTKKEEQNMITGFYYSKSEYGNYYNLLLLAGVDIYKKDRGYSACLILCFGLIENYNSIFKTHMGFYTVYGYVKHYDDASYHFNLSIVYWQARNDYRFYSILLPVYYYRSTKDENAFLLLPALLYFSSHADSKMQLAAAGILWYSDWNNNIDGSSYLLLGTLLSSVAHPSREYSSIGSLWGILWEYQKENVTGWRKFSILKFVFSMVTEHDETKYRIFGINL